MRVKDTCNTVVIIYLRITFSTNSSSASMTCECFMSQRILQTAVGSLYTDVEVATFSALHWLCWKVTVVRIARCVCSTIITLQHNAIAQYIIVIPISYTHLYTVTYCYSDLMELCISFAFKFPMPLR